MNYLSLEDAEQLNQVPTYVVCGIMENKNVTGQERFSSGQTMVFFGPPDSMPENLLQFFDFKIYKCSLSEKTTKEWQGQSQNKLDAENKRYDDLAKNYKPDK